MPSSPLTRTPEGRRDRRSSGWKRNLLCSWTAGNSARKRFFGIPATLLRHHDGRIVPRDGPFLPPALGRRAVFRHGRGGGRHGADRTGPPGGCERAVRSLWEQIAFVRAATRPVGRPRSGQRLCPAWVQRALQFFPASLPARRASDACTAGAVAVLRFAGPGDAPGRQPAQHRRRRASPARTDGNHRRFHARPRFDQRRAAVPRRGRLPRPRAGPTMT